MIFASCHSIFNKMFSDAIAAKRNNESLSQILTAVILLAITLLVRFPFFFRDVYNWDESTFIIVAQDMLNGHLPYDFVWDLKPPLTFAFFTAVISLFGKSIPAIRLAGALNVALAAYLVQRVGAKVWDGRTGWCAACLLVFYSVVLDSGTCVGSEILAISPLAATMLILMRERISQWSVFFAGLCIAAACLNRLNLCYVALGLFMYLLARASGDGPKASLKILAAYGAGFVLPVAAFFLPYFAAGKSDLFLNAMITTPMTYSEQIGVGQALINTIGNAFSFKSLTNFGLLTAAILWGGWHLFHTAGDMPRDGKKRLFLIVILFASTYFSILKTGQKHEHYLIQTLPFVCLFAARACLSAFRFFAIGSPRQQIAMGIACALLLTRPIGTILWEYKTIASRALTGQRLVYGLSYDLADYLQRANPGHDTVYLMDSHLAYWLTGTIPVRKIITHPSNLGKEFMIKAVLGPSSTVESEMENILDDNPKFIVRRERISYLKTFPEAMRLLETRLATGYVLDGKVGPLLVYRRIDGSTPKHMVLAN